MPYVFVENFAAGLDVRKPPVAGVPGSLQELHNCHIARGGFIETRKRGVIHTELPPGDTFGLLGAYDRLFVFGTADPATITLPAGVHYVQLISTAVTLGTIVEVISAKMFDGLPYCIVQFDDGSVYHFYNGLHVTAWEDGESDFDTRNLNSIASTLAAHTDGFNGITSNSLGPTIEYVGVEDGTPFTITGDATGPNATMDVAVTQTGAPGVAGAVADGSFDVVSGTTGAAATGGQLRMRGPGPGSGPNAGTSNPIPVGAGFSSIKANAIELLSDTVVNESGSDPAGSFGNALAANINENPDHDFTATYHREFDTAQSNVLETYTEILDLVGGVEDGAGANGPLSWDITGGTFSVTMVSLTGGVDTSNLRNVQVDSINLIEAKVPWNTDAIQTAADVETAINAFTATSGFNATRSSATVEVHTVEETDNYNGEAISLSVRDGFSVGGQVDMAGGLLPIPATREIASATVGGPWTATNTYTVTLDGTPFVVVASDASSSKGRDILVKASKVHVTVDSIARFSAIDDPTDWDDEASSGAGFINMSTHAAGSEALIGMGLYQGDVAFFSKYAVQRWFIDPDEANNAHLQTIENSGAVSPRSIVTFSDIDTFYLSQGGVRSLRARDSSGSAWANDIGSAIDDLIVQTLLDFGKLPEEELVNNEDFIIERVIAVVEPVEGRLWVILGPKIFVFSYFPGADVSAWSTYEFSKTVTEAGVAFGRLFLRAEDTIYVYGGLQGDEYPAPDEMRASVKLPYLDADKPAHKKTLLAVDGAFEGSWRMDISVDPNRPEATVPVGIVDKITYGEQAYAADGECTHFAPEFYTTSGGRSWIASLAVHYELADAK